jgi:hypothetical protein
MGRPRKHVDVLEVLRLKNRWLSGKSPRGASLGTWNGTDPSRPQQKPRTHLSQNPRSVVLLTAFD